MINYFSISNVFFVNTYFLLISNNFGLLLRKCRIFSNEKYSLFLYNDLNIFSINLKSSKSEEFEASNDNETLYKNFDKIINNIKLKKKISNNYSFTQKKKF